MSSIQNQQVGYGLTNALQTIFVPPIISLRAPTTSDKGQLGTVWIYKTINAAYILTSIVNNSATWSDVTGGAGVFTSLTVTPGPISLTGTTTINTTGAAATSIGTGGTGAVSIGNTTGGTTITGLLTTGALTTVGTTSINASGAAATTIATGGTGTLALGNATGNTTVTGLLTTGAITAVGTTSINASGAASTTIATGGTGTLALGNATGNTSVTGTMTVSSTLTTTNGNHIAGGTDASSTGPNIELRKSRGGGVITTGDVLGNLIFEGYDGTSNIAGAAIVSTSSGTIAANRVAGNLQFWTHPNSAGAALQRVVIDSAGQMVINAPDSGVGLEITSGPSGTALKIDADDIVMANGNIKIDTAAKYIQLPGNIRLLTGAGAPAGGLANVVGTTYFRTDAGGATERIYVATAAGAWTNVTCAA